MAYTPTEWKNGDVITAEKLNKLEEGVQEASGGELATVFNSSITTTSNGNIIMGSFVPTIPIEGESVLVLFENVTYELPKAVLPFGVGYGEFDNSNNPILTNYPCAIGVSNGNYYFFTSEANTYEVKIKAEVLNKFFTINIFRNGTGISLSRTRNEILDAINNNNIVFIKDNHKCIHVSNFSHEDSMSGRYLYLSGLAWDHENGANELVVMSYTLVISPQSGIDIHEKAITLTTTSE